MLMYLIITKREKCSEEKNIAIHRVLEIYNAPDNIITFSETAYTETISELCRLRNAGQIDQQLYDDAISSFLNEFILCANPNVGPIDIADVIKDSHEVIRTCYKLKDEIDNSLSYIQSLDALQIGSWLHAFKVGLKPKFVTVDNKLVKIANAYKDYMEYDVEVINLNMCGCLECASIKQSQQTA